MIDRINKNEERLDSVISSIKSLEKSILEFKSNKRNINLLNKYYGSKSWFKDKDDYESKRIVNIKAGVLSEDAIWNMNDDINDLLDEMKDIINYFKKV